MKRLLIQMTIAVAAFWFGVNAVSFLWDPLTRPMVDAEQVTETATPEQIIPTAPPMSAHNTPLSSSTASEVKNRKTSIPVTDYDVFVDIKNKRFWSVREHPDYAKLPSAFRQLIAEKAKKKINTFYVAKVDTKINSTYVFWKEENVLILLEPYVGYDWKYALLWSRRYWEYESDVVPTLDDVKGSSYLLTRANWRKSVASCLRGDKFTFEQTRK